MRRDDGYRREPVVWTNGVAKRTPEARLNWHLRQGAEAPDVPRRQYDPYADL